MSERQLHIHIDIGGLRGQLARSLQKTFFLVAAGLQKVGQVQWDFLGLPTPFEITFDQTFRWTEEAAKEAYSEWILANGFRDAIESVGTLLEEAHKVLTIWEVVGERASAKLLERGGTN